MLSPHLLDEALPFPDLVAGIVDSIDSHFLAALPVHINDEWERRTTAREIVPRMLLKKNALAALHELPDDVAIRQVQDFSLEVMSMLQVHRCLPASCGTVYY